MKKLLLLGTLICSLPLMATGANKKTETTDEFIDSLVKGPTQAKETDDFKEEQAEGTYFGDDSVSTKSKIKTGARLAAVGLAGAGVAAAGTAIMITTLPMSAPVAIVLGGQAATGVAGTGIMIVPLYNGITPLEIAITDDNITKVKSLLSKNPKLAQLTTLGRLPLHFAALRNTDPIIIQELLKSFPGATRVRDGKEAGMIPLGYAIKNKFSALKKAWSRHDVENPHKVFDALLKADPSALQVTFGKGKKTLLGEKIDLKNSLFHKAALVDDPYYLQALLKANPQGAQRANAFGNLPLHAAAAQGNKEAITILIKVYKDGIKTKNEDGKIPAQLAANDEIKVMLGAKLKVGFLDNLKGTFSSKTTTLHIAANKGDNETLLKILQKEPSSAAMPDKDGNLPLHLAAMRKDGLDAVKALLKAFPKATTIKNLQGQTAEDVAATEEIKNYLFL